MFPFSRKRTFQGPHTTCLMTAETYHRRFLKTDTMKGKEMGSATRMKKWAYSQYILYFMSGLSAMLIFFILGTVFVIGYVLTRIFLRFQYKIAVFLVLCQRRPFELRQVNHVLVQVLQIMLLLIGGLGYICLLFVDM